MGRSWGPGLRLRALGPSTARWTQLGGPASSPGCRGCAASDPAEPSSSPPAPKGPPTQGLGPRGLAGGVGVGVEPVLTEAFVRLRQGSLLPYSLPSPSGEQPGDTARPSRADSPKARNTNLQGQRAAVKFKVVRLSSILQGGNGGPEKARGLSWSRRQRWARSGVSSASPSLGISARSGPLVFPSG